MRGERAHLGRKFVDELGHLGLQTRKEHGTIVDRRLAAARGFRETEKDNVVGVVGTPAELTVCVACQRPRVAPARVEERRTSEGRRDGLQGPRWPC